MIDSRDRETIRVSELKYLTAHVYLASAWSGKHYQWFPIGTGHVLVGSQSDWHGPEARVLVQQHHLERQAKLAKLPNPARIPGFGGY